MLLKELLTGGHKHSVGHVSGVQRIDSVDLAKARLAKRHKEQEVAKQHEETDAVLRALGDQLTAAQHTPATAATSRLSNAQQDSNAAGAVEGSTSESTQQPGPSSSALSQSHVTLLPLPDAQNAQAVSPLHNNMSPHTLKLPTSQAPNTAAQCSVCAAGQQCDLHHPAAHQPLPAAGPSNAPSVDTSESDSTIFKQSQLARERPDSLLITRERWAKERPDKLKEPKVPRASGLGRHSSAAAGGGGGARSRSRSRSQGRRRSYGPEDGGTAGGGGGPEEAVHARGSGRRSGARSRRGSEEVGYASGGGAGWLDRLKDGLHSLLGGGASSGGHAAGHSTGSTAHPHGPDDAMFTSTSLPPPVTVASAKSGTLPGLLTSLGLAKDGSHTGHASGHASSGGSGLFKGGSAKSHLSSAKSASASLPPAKVLLGVGVGGTTSPPKAPAPMGGSPGQRHYNDRASAGAAYSTSTTTGPSGAQRNSSIDLGQLGSHGHGHGQGYIQMGQIMQGRQSQGHASSVQEEGVTSQTAAGLVPQQSQHLPAQVQDQTQLGASGGQEPHQSCQQQQQQQGAFTLKTSAGASLQSQQGANIGNTAAPSASFVRSAAVDKGPAASLQGAAQEAAAAAAVAAGTAAAAAASVLPVTHQAGVLAEGVTSSGGGGAGNAAATAATPTELHGIQQPVLPHPPVVPHQPVQLLRPLGSLQAVPSLSSTTSSGTTTSRRGAGAAVPPVAGSGVLARTAAAVGSTLAGETGGEQYLAVEPAAHPCALREQEAPQQQHQITHRPQVDSALSPSARS